MTSSDVSAYADWIGRERRRTDILARSDVARMAALFDREETPRILPPAWHWGALTETDRQSRIGSDGHPARGAFMPPIPAPLRMFAQAEMRFFAEVQVGVATELHEQVASVVEKTGRAGVLTFVELKRRLSQDGMVRLEETQTIVYRDRAPGPAPAPTLVAPAQPAQWRRTIRPDPVLLFRFSAATFNSHRIHYDRPYAMDVEAYPALVVHGPLIALSLLEALHGAVGGAQVRGFSFRALRPLFDNAPFEVCGTLDGALANLWAEAPDGGVAMSAQAQLGPY